MRIDTKAISGFSNAVESLKKYRRADLVDEEGKNILDKLYTDLLPEEYILNKCLLDNTTYLIGRKGTGKSTLFLKMENELRKKKNCLPCYIDVKTIYESSQAQNNDMGYLGEYFDSETLKKYLMERTFIQSVLIAISNELSQINKSNIMKAIGMIVKPKDKQAKEKIESMIERINNNDYLKEIEVPILKQSHLNLQDTSETIKSKEYQVGGGETSINLSHDGVSASHKSGINFNRQQEDRNGVIATNNFSEVFIKVFEIKTIILELKEILELLEVRHLFIMLDDLSEIEDNAIVTFVDSIIAPLNNWSEEFIKFKIASYPNRIHYGNIDPSKVDIINLDFYNLYSEFDRDKMEEYAYDFTQRLVEKRILYYTGMDASNFFDLTKTTMKEYYELLFQVSMNVPRIIGYILSYCHQNKIIFGKVINKNDIELSAEKYFNEKINLFFQSNIYSLMSLDEKASNFQLNEISEKIVNKLVEVKKRIVSGDLKGKIYIKSTPFSSHFHIEPSLSKHLKTLELNHFISKYNELSNKDGKQVDIYSINFGLAAKNNLLWGKPNGTSYRKYFIERPFSFTKLINDHVYSVKTIQCSNEQCGRLFEEDKIPFLEFNNFKCNNCGAKVIISDVKNEIKKKISQVNRELLLPKEDLKIIVELSCYGDEGKFAREIAEELDFSKHIIAYRCKLLDIEKSLVKRSRIKDSAPYKYSLSNEAREKYINSL